jgi:tetratricopeptide (TPR) repeat protein
MTRQARDMNEKPNNSANDGGEAAAGRRVRLFGLLINVRLALLALFLLALGLRLLYLYLYSGHVFFRELVVDEAAYDTWARRIAAGEWLGTKVFYQDPLYPYLLAVIYRLFGRDLTLVYVLQAMLSALCVLPMYGLGRRMFDDGRVGLLAALFWAAYKVSFFFDGQIEKTGPGMALIIAALWLLVLVRDRPKIVYALAAGLAWGLACLYRGNFLAVAPVLFVWLGWTLWRRLGRAAAAPLMAFALAAMLMPGLSALRNYAVSGEQVLTTAQGGVNFYVGNFRQNAWGTGLDPPFARRTPVFEESDFAREARRLTGRDLGPSELDRFWYRQGLKEIAADPVRFAARLGRKALLILNVHEVSDNLNYYFFRDHVVGLLKWPLPAFWLAGPFGLAGMALALRRKKGGVLALYVLAYSLTLLAFYVVGRYRLPIVPPLLLFAAYGLIALLGSLRPLDKKAVMIYCLALAAAGALGYPEWRRPVYDESWRKMGHAYEDEQKWAEAISCYEKALAINPRMGQAWLGMGVALEHRDRFADALAAFRKAVADDPGFAPGHYLLGLSLERNGRSKEAREEYQRALELDPNLQEARTALTRLGRGGAGPIP